MHRLYKRGSVYWTRINGKRISTGCTDLRAAELHVRELERISADPSYAAEKTVSVDDAVGRLILDQKRRKRAAATLEITETKGGHLCRVFAEFAQADRAPLATIDAKNVDRYIARREAEGAKATTVARELSVLRQTLKLALRVGDYSRALDKVMPIGLPDGYVPRKRWLPPDELTKLLDHVHLHHAAHLAFIAATGADVGESIAACRNDADLDRWTVRIRGHKNKYRPRIVPITIMHRELLMFALENAPGDAPLFRRWAHMQRDVKLAAERAGIERCRPTDLRRTHATWLRNAGVEPQLLGPILGHVTSEMAERVYARLGDDALRDLLDSRTAGAVSFLYRRGAQNGPNGVQLDDLTSENTGKSVPPAGVEPAANALGKRCSIH